MAGVFGRLTLQPGARICKNLRGHGNRTPVDGSKIPR